MKKNKITKTYLEQKCKDIIKKYDIKEKINEEDSKFLYWLFKFHHHYDEKFNTKEVDYLFIDTNIYNTTSFYIKYKDVTCDDISFKRAVSDITKEELRKINIDAYGEQQ